MNGEAATTVSTSDPEFDRILAQRENEAVTSPPEQVFDWINPPRATPLEQIEMAKHQKEIEERNTEKACVIYKSGQFPEILIGEFQKIWSGDTHILKWIIAAFANGFVENADEALHIYISGQSGLGKSEGVKAALKLLPTSLVIKGQFSRKGFLYLAPTLSPGTIVMHDDHEIDEDEAGLYRAMIASWKEPDAYYSVDKTQSRVIEPAARITQIITNADGLSSIDSSGQNESRFCTLEIKRNDDDMKRIFDFIKENNNNQNVIDPSLLSIWSIITEKKKVIDIPFINRITIDPQALYKIREFKRFLTLIRSIALLRGRDAATTDDFNEACQMWTYQLLMLDNEIPGLTPSETTVFEQIRCLTAGGKRAYLSKLKDNLTNMSSATIYRAFSGKGGNFQNVRGGLLTKIRGLSIEPVFDHVTGEHDRVITYFKDRFQQIGSAPYNLQQS